MVVLAEAEIDETEYQIVETAPPLDLMFQLKSRHQELAVDPPDAHTREVLVVLRLKLRTTFYRITVTLTATGWHSTIQSELQL